MRPPNLLLAATTTTAILLTAPAAAIATTAAAAATVSMSTSRIGLTTYKEIREGANNSAAIAYDAPDHSGTLFLSVQITADHHDHHAQIVDDFRTLARNYGSNGAAVIPRVSYYDSGSAEMANNASVILDDVAMWAEVFAAVGSGTVEIPVIQVGFLGVRGEWHDGPFCTAQGTDETPANLEVKRRVVEALRQGNGARKVALRYPRDHRVLFPGDRTVTLHDDCLFGGGSDAGTFGDGEDRQFWVDYVKQVAAGNTYGGRSRWSDWADLCGEMGDGEELVGYIHDFRIAYLNPANSTAFQEPFLDSNWIECIDAIQVALRQYS